MSLSPARVLLTSAPCTPATSSTGDADAPSWSVSLARPVAQWEARRLDEVRPLLAAAEADALAGAWSVFLLAYEAAPAFEPRMAVHPPASLDAIAPLPLAWAAAFHGPEPQPPHAPPASHAHGYWQPLVDAAAYRAGFARIRQLLQAGEVYQVNYTMPFVCQAGGDLLAWHRALLATQQPGYGAFVDLGSVQILSCSPELFFHRLPDPAGDRLLARPMKGTAPRGRTPQEDDARAAALAASPKERAENIMIVDLLRNDLGRLARPGGVAVRHCCRVERYPTVLQMVSDVTATLRPGTRLQDILTALFPCGSVTGAPKLAAMQAIHALEPHPRGVYCGAIGLIKPGGETICSVPIRTLVVRQGRAVCSVGGGITWDSALDGEYAECRLKLRFADPEPFSLLESLVLEHGRLPYLEQHLARCAASAAVLGVRFQAGPVREALLRTARETPQARHKLRLLVEADGAFRIESHPLPPLRRTTLRLALDSSPVDSSDPFLSHKTTRRSRFEAALARFPEAHDVLLYNERGELTECCFGNLVLRKDGQLLTPAATCGLLPGIYRQRLLARGILREAVLRREDLRTAEALWRINAVRRWQSARLC